MIVPYVNLAAQHAPIKEELLAAVGNVIDHGHFILGGEVAEFEERFAKLCQVNYALGLNSGTDALILALKALGIGPGDEVITPPNSFVASTSCITLLGASPVFVDVAEDYNIDPSLIEQAITPRTRAIIPVHLTGRPADMDPIMDVARRHGLHVVEDCAQAFGAEYKGKRVGSFGTVGCFSLHPLKTLNACGDGGLITTNDPGLFEEIKQLRNHGLVTHDDCAVWGHNSRLDSVQAAILLVKLRYVEGWTEKRRANASFYQSALGCLPQVQVPWDPPNVRAVYHTFVIQADRRDDLKGYLKHHGVSTGTHYPTPIHLQAAAAELGHNVGSFPVTERQANKIVSLPVYPELGHDQLEYVADLVRSFYEVALW
jgi:dTDP-4-amino-4,6-dideoxygalactose transaminase